MSTRRSDALIRGAVLIIIVLGTITLVAVFNLTGAVHTIRQSSQHGDCKTTATADHDDKFEHNVASLLVDLANNKIGAATDIAKAMKDEPRTADVIAATCPSLNGSKTPPANTTTTTLRRAP